MLKTNIEKKTIDNQNYRKVLTTTDQMQLVVMCLKPLEDIPKETHSKTTQFIRIEKGNGLIQVGDKSFRVSDGDSVVIPAGSEHYVKNTGKKELRLYTIYAPPEHAPVLTQKHKPIVY